jgi:hypothetical protein
LIEIEQIHFLRSGHLFLNILLIVLSLLKTIIPALNTAILLENQEKWCIEEANLLVTAVLSVTVLLLRYIFNPPGNPVNSGDNYAPGDARLPKVLIPMIRRTFPELITNEIVGVQPMSGPVGLAFALRYAYQSDTLGRRY